jgi:hypothetical protein
MLHTLNGLLLAASLFLVGGGLWFRDSLPPPQSILAASLPEPIQVAQPREPFTVDSGGIRYTVAPLHTYELRGLVVSRHDTSVWWNPTHRSWWKDLLNVADLCVVWGDNLAGSIGSSPIRVAASPATYRLVTGRPGTGSTRRASRTTTC